jgi:hypothetical protein
MIRIHYDPACDRYVRYEIYEHHGVKHVRKHYMEYYSAKTSVPKVTRKENGRIQSTGLWSDKDKALYK